MKTQFFPAVILTLCLTPSQEQTGCQDINAFCGNWANRGLCTSQREFMQEQCPRTCSFCGVTQVLFPGPSIAKPDFKCGEYDVRLSALNRQKRQLGNILGGIIGSIGGGSRPSQSVSGGSNRPSVPSFNPFRPDRNPSIPSFNPFRPDRNPSIPSFNPFRPDRNPSVPPNRNPFPNSIIPQPGRRPSRPSIPTALPIIPQPGRRPSRPSIPTALPIIPQPARRPLKPLISTAPPNILPSFPNIISQISIPNIIQTIITNVGSQLPTGESESFTTADFPAPVGGGTKGATPSVGIVYPVQPSSSNPRPSAVKVIPRPTAVVGTFPITRPPIVNPVQPRPVPVIPNPRPIQAITPTPVIQPVGVTSAVIPLIGPQGLEEAICGSVPITDRFLLSAAHCFHNQRLRYRIRLGEVDISQTGEVNSLPQDVDIERIYIHPGYTHSSRVRYNDIALLKTIQKIRFSRLVFPLCILPKPIDVTGAPLTVAGFGLVNGTYRSPVLQAAELEGLNDARCQQRYRDLGHDLSLRDRYPDLLVGKGILCASAPGKSACQGDSGGPLTIRDQMGRQFVLGVVSIGASCLGNSLSTLPGLYTDVAFHVDWINEVIYGP